MAITLEIAANVACMPPVPGYAWLIVSKVQTIAKEIDFKSDGQQYAIFSIESGRREACVDCS